MHTILEILFVTIMLIVGWILYYMQTPSFKKTFEKLNKESECSLHIIKRWHRIQDKKEHSTKEPVLRLVKPKTSQRML